MTARHHYLPRVYLRGWCVDGKLVRHRRAGTPLTLREERVTPQSFAFEQDLYRLPRGGIANGLDDQLEKLLSHEIERSFPELLEGLRTVGSGVVTDAPLAEAVRRFMQVTLARSPEMLRKSAHAVRQVQAEHAAAGERMRARAITPKAQDELRQLFDPRRGEVSARAMVEAVISGLAPPGWLTGPLRIVRADEVPAALEAIGIEAFATTDEPLVEWADGPFVASFVLAPDLMAVVLKDAAAANDEAIGSLATQHHLTAPMNRVTRYAISRAPLPDGSLLKGVLAQFLAPWRSRQR